jgi:uncharacterized protein YrrD
MAELLGLPVINRSNGEILGEVDDVIYRPVSSRILGLVIRSKERYYTESDNIYKIGSDLIVLNHSSLVHEYQQSPGIGIAEQNGTVIGETVITSDGDEIGAVNDLVIDEKNYQLVGYEVSGGVIQDVLQGRNILSFDENITYGKDALIINSEGDS